MGKAEMPQVAQKSDQELQEIWQLYRREKDPKARRELILNYSYLVKYVAGRVMIHLPSYVELDDLISYGTMGLIDAVQGFNPEQGVKFSTYAVARIKGAIYDALRAMDWVPRSVREKAKMISKAMAELEQKNKKTPTDEEVAAHLGISQEKLEKILAQVTIPQVMSLDGLRGNDEEEERIPFDIPGPSEDDPLNIVQDKDMKELLGKAIERLPEKEKLVVALYYYDGLTLREIGEVLDLSAARISQLHSKAILRLRGMLGREKSSFL